MYFVNVRLNFLVCFGGLCGSLKTSTCWRLFLHPAYPKWIYMMYKCHYIHHDQSSAKVNLFQQTCITLKLSADLKWADITASGGRGSSRDAVSTVYLLQKQMTAWFVITGKHKGTRCLFPFFIFYSVITSFYLLLSVFFYFLASWIKFCDAINQNSREIAHLKTSLLNGQKLKAKKNFEEALRCCVQ